MVGGEGTRGFQDEGYFLGGVLFPDPSVCLFVCLFFQLTMGKGIKENNQSSERGLQGAKVMRVLLPQLCA